MDWEAVKLVGIVVSLVGGALTIGEKVCKWGKSAYQHFKKDTQLHHDAISKNSRKSLAFARQSRLLKKVSEATTLGKSFPTRDRTFLKKIASARPASFTASGSGRPILSKPDFVTFGGYGLFKKI